MLEALENSERLAEIISHSTAGAFLLGAVAAFLAVLLSRTETLLGRLRHLMLIEEREKANAYPERNIETLKRRISTLNHSTFYAICSAIAGTALVITAFVCGLLNVAHEYAMALLFLVTLGTLAFSLFLFGQEVNTARREFNLPEAAPKADAPRS